MSKFYYGGQAVLEGVMMRGRDRMSVAVRRPDGTLAYYDEALNPRIFAGRLARTPLLRGVVMLWEMMSLGVKAMGFSARVATGEEEQEQGSSGLGLTVASAVLFAIFLFFLLPLGTAELFGRWVESDLGKNLVEGVARLVILLGYIWLIGKVPEIGRVFGYHGAEHKTINAYEAGAPLSPESVRRYSTRHPRCGTGFLLVVVVVSVFVFVTLGWPNFWLLVLSRILLVPVIAAISYELLRLGARYYHVPAVRAVLAPSLTLQGLTTREPDDGMIETAIAALLRVLPESVPQDAAEAAPELV